MRTIIAPALSLLFSSTIALAQPAPEPPPPPLPPAEPAAAPEPPPESEPPPTLEIAPPVAPIAAAEPMPPADPVAARDRLPVGKEGFWQPGILLQFWGFAREQDDQWESTFRVRRAELRVKGEIARDLVVYNVMIDPAKVLDGQTSTVSILQDFFITFISEYADVSVGQFKIPVSWEGYGGSSKLLFPERSLVSREFGDQRDIGLRVDKQLGMFYYSAGLFNGAGQNRRDDNNQKDAALRVEVYPIDGLMIGAVGYGSIGERDSEPGTRDVLEGDVRLEQGDLLVQGEYIRHWQGPSGGREQGQGFYLGAGYTFMDRMQPVVRVGVVDHDIDITEDQTWHYELGFNYYLRNHEMKLQASYSMFDVGRNDPGKVQRSPNRPREESTRHELILAAQVSF
jgi:hypothetical protein